MLCENGCNDGGGPFEYTNRKAVNGMDQERKWIREVQRHRSQTAADHLIRAHYDEIYRFVYRQTGHMEDAMDLTQDIFLAVLRAIHTYDEGKAAFRTWLFRIAANKVIDARRRAPLEEDFAAQVADRLLLDQIEAYVSALDAQTQAIFRLRLYGERTFPEIAAALEVPEPAVKAKYYRLMGRLRKEFDPHD